MIRTPPRPLAARQKANADPMKRRDMMSLRRSAGALASRPLGRGPNCGDRGHRAASIERVFNLGTAKASGLTNPQALWPRAEEVIQ